MLKSRSLNFYESNSFNRPKIPRYSSNFPKPSSRIQKRQSCSWSNYSSKWLTSKIWGWKAVKEACIIKRDNEIHFQKIDSTEVQQRILSINTNPGYLLHNSHAIENTKVNPFENMTKRTFLPCYEEILSSFTKASFMDCIQMDFEYIKEEARNFYYTPYVIAERISYEIFSRSKKQIYTTFTKNRYTEEFISECCERESRYHNSTIFILEEIKESGLPEPQFSDY